MHSRRSGTEGRELTSHRYRQSALLLMVTVQLMLAFMAMTLIGLLVVRPHSVTGEQKVIVLCVWSDDAPPTTSAGVIEVRMRGVSDYFLECSYSKVKILSTVSGWMKLSKPMTWYAEPQVIGAVEHTAAKDDLIFEAISVADGLVDFAPYDRLLVVHSGHGSQEVGGNSSLIGTCHTADWYSTLDGRVFTGASVVSEFEETGAIAHELAHDFGAPDLYDYWSSEPQMTGMSSWDLMNSGSDNGVPRGSIPSHMCAYTKYRVGWIEDHDILSIRSDSYCVELIPMSIQTPGYRAVRYDLPDGRYYLVEARSRIGFDSSLPGAGVLVMLVNESRLDEMRDGVQLQIPAVASWLGDAALRGGETFNDTCHSFAVKVVDWTDQLAIVDVSTTLVQEWSVSERIRLDRGSDAQGVYVTTAHTDWYLREATNPAFAAVFVSNKSVDYVNIYYSSNSGRDWSFLASTNRTVYRLNRYDFSFCYFQGLILLVGQILGPEESFYGALAYSFISDAFFLTNLTDISKAHVWAAAGSAGTEALYICGCSSLNGTLGIMYFRLFNSQWNHTFCPLPGLVQLAMANVIDDHNVPLVLYRDGMNTLRLVRFNTTEILYEWTASEAGLYNFDIVCSHNAVLVVYHDGFNNETYWSVHLHIEIGQPETGFRDLLHVHCYSPMWLNTLCYKNTTDTFHVVEWASGNMTEIVVQNDLVSNTSLDPDEYAMPKADLTEGWARILLGFDYSAPDALFSVSWVTGPQETEDTSVYYPVATSFAFPQWFWSVLSAAILSFVVAAFTRKRTIRSLRRIRASRLWQKRWGTLRLQAAVYARNRRPYIISPVWFVPNTAITALVLGIALSSPIGYMFVLVGNEFVRLSPPMQSLSLLSALSTILATCGLEGRVKYPLWLLSALPFLSLPVGVVYSNPTAFLVFRVYVVLFLGIVLVEGAILYLTKKEIAYTRSLVLLSRVLQSLERIPDSSLDRKTRDAVARILSVLSKEDEVLLVATITDALVSQEDVRIRDDELENVLEAGLEVRECLPTDERNQLEHWIRVLNPDALDEG